MTESTELSVLYEGGVLKPDKVLGLPDRTRLLIAIRRVETSPQAELSGRKRLHEIRDSGIIRLEGWHPGRDEMHERR